MSDEFDAVTDIEDDASVRAADKRARNRKLLIFYITAFAAVVVGAVLLCIFVFFRVDSVTVVGGESYRQEDILSVCGINSGDNLVLLSTSDREQEIEHRFPYIEKVDIKKKIPSSVEIIITEAETEYSIEAEQGYVYVSNAGKVLEIAAEPAPGSAVVTGIRAVNTEPSQTVEFEQDEDAQLFEAITSQINERDFSGITSIDMSNRYDITMLYDDRIVFIFGNTTGMQSKMAYGIETLNYMLNDGTITGETKGEINLTMVPDKKKVVYGEIVDGRQNTVVIEGVAGRDKKAAAKKEE